MLSKDGKEAIIVRGFDEMNHFVHDHVFNEVPGLRHEVCVEADVPCLVITASPFGFHPLEKICAHFHVKLRFPFFDE